MKVMSPVHFSETRIRIIMKFTHIVGTSFTSQASTFNIATCYGLNGPGIEPWWERDFLYPSRLILGVHKPSTPSSNEIKEREELYLYSPSWPSGPALV